MKRPKDLYVITTAKKRDALDWEREASNFMVTTNRDSSVNGVKIVVDSWNNIIKYVDVKNAFFIFDEQRLVGSGAWVKAFLKLAKNNHWLLLTATPGDKWTEYIPVFVANGFYKNRTEFLKRHVVYSRFTQYPKIERYIDVDRLIALKRSIIVYMPYLKKTLSHDIVKTAQFNQKAIDKIIIERWNEYTNMPVKDVSEMCALMRKTVNSDPSRVEIIKEISKTHKKLIIFYNFNYELEILRAMCEDLNMSYSEWNGHKHQQIPKKDSWIYLVQYTAGAEGWNCIETNAIVFYSQNYSYKIMVQSAGRIDRINTPFKDLYYYHIKSNSLIDLAISKCLVKKKDFNENRFMSV